MLYRNDKIVVEQDIETLGEDIDDVMMNEFYVAFGEAMKNNHAVEMSVTPSDWNKYDRLFSAEVHVYHPDEMRKIEYSLHELYTLEQFNEYEIQTRIREIAEMLGFLNRNKEHISENMNFNFNGH